MATFEKIVTALSLPYKEGLGALKGKEKAFISPREPQMLEGSIDLDKHYEASQSNDNRWDYLIGYDGKVYCVEIHPASSQHEVEKLIAKGKWLSEWLNTKGKALKPCVHRPYFWIPTGKVCTQIKHTTNARKLAQNGISRPISLLILPPKL